MEKLSRDEILKQVLSEEPVDYYENYVSTKVYLKAACITFGVIFIVFLLKLFLKHELDVLIWGIGFSFICTGILLEGTGFKKKSKIIFGIILLIASLIAIILGLL